MAVDVRVRNFQSIRDATLRIAGFTVVTGENNRGKSALIRAIKALASNAKGHAFVRHGADSCIVDLRFADGTEISWEKGERVKPRYVIAGKDLHPGAQVPSEVVALGLAPVTVGDRDLWPQIASQFSGQVFLLDQPGSVLAEVVADVDRVGQLNRALRAAESDRRAAVSEIKVRRADLDRLEDDLASMDGLDAALSLVQGVAESERDIARLQADLSVRRALASRLSVARSALGALRGVADIKVPDAAGFATLRNQRSERDRLRVLNVKLVAAKGQVALLAAAPGIQVPGQAVIDAMRKTRDQVATFRSLAARLSKAKGVRAGLAGLGALPDNLDASLLTRMLGQRAQLDGFRRRRETARALIETLADSLAGQAAALEAEEVAVKTLIAELGVCPICGVPSTDVHDGHQVVSDGQVQGIVQDMQKLDPPPGSLVLIRVSLQDPAAVEALGVQLHDAMVESDLDAALLVTPADFDVQMLDASQMAEMGWQRSGHGTKDDN